MKSSIMIGKSIGVPVECKHLLERDFRVLMCYRLPQSQRVSDVVTPGGATMSRMRIRILITCSVAVVAINTYLASDALSGEATALTAARPMLAVEGTLRSDVSTDLLSLTYDDQTDKLEFTLTNWANGEFKYSEGTLFRQGVVVAVNVGSGSKPPKLAEGRVTELAPNFPGNTPSTMTIRVAGSGRQATSSSAVQVNYGSTLTEFYPVEKADGSISCTGTVSNINDLVRGMTLRVGGVGSRFNGNYLVSGTVHSFDQTKGLRTTFTAGKNPVTRSLPSSKRSG
jgi:hypothetical protein